MTSRVTPHCFRRAWATIALNDEKNPTPIDVVSEVLRHKNIATTRRHYAPWCADCRQKVEGCCEGGGCPSVAEVLPVAGRSKSG